ncbi:MAG: hypothetical protein D6681_18290, partial [Calditrichaeota bacterium]
MTEQHLLPIKLLVYDHQAGEILSPVVSANYPVATPLRDFLLDMLLHLHTDARRVEFLTNVDDRFVERIDRENPHHPYYHVLAVLYSPETTSPSLEHADRGTFLAALPEGDIRERLHRFLNLNLLEADRLLELSNRIVRVNVSSLPTELAHALKGILFLEAESEGVSLAYYTGDRILYEQFQLQEDGAARLVEKRTFRVYRDIASRNDPFDFHIIRRALARNELLFVDHFNGQRRELKTFQREIQQETQAESEPENQSQQPTKTAYRDTGNRVLTMNLLEEKHARLDFGFLIREL